jgi:sugar phosphate isomerase/epimerase
MTWTLSAFADEAGGEINAQIAALKRAGLRRIDPRSVNGHNIAALPMEVAKEVRAKLDAAGIRVNMFGSPIGKIDVTDDLQTDLDRLAHLGKLAPIFDCQAVRMFSFYNKTKLSHAQWQTKSIDALSKLRDLAAKLNLVLYHENESDIFGDKSDDVLVIADKLRGPNFKMIYDFANYIRTGEEGWTTWSKCQAITDCFHFKDQRKDNVHTPIGQGETDAKRIMAAAAAGWSGPCTLEPHLTHSAAVLATHTSGTKGSAALKDLPPAETFHIAAQACTALLDELKIKWE